MSPVMTSDSVVLFLCGDVMLGRGIDQSLPHPSDPQLYEPVVRSALEYVQLAEAVNGPIPCAVPPGYVWGDALPELACFRPTARIVNLETSITKSATYLPKGINYRMSPETSEPLPPQRSIAARWRTTRPEELRANGTGRSDEEQIANGLRQQVIALGGEAVGARAGDGTASGIAA
jgi:hypothetical protein